MRLVSLVSVLIFGVFACKTKSSASSSDASEKLSNEDKAVELLLAEYKAYPIPQTGEEKPQGLGLSWAGSFSDFFHKRLGGSDDTMIHPVGEGYIARTKEYFAQQGPESQKRLWNEALNDWNNGKTYTPNDMGKLTPSYDMFKTVLGGRKDFQILADFSKLKSIDNKTGKIFTKDGFLFKGPDNTYAIILRKKNGEMTFRELPNYNPEQMKILLNPNSKEPILIDFLKNVKDVKPLLDLEEVRKVLLTKKTRNFAVDDFERMVNQFLERFLEQKRVDLNGLILKLKGEDRFNNPAGNDFLADLAKFSNKVDLEDSAFESKEFLERLGQLTQNQKLSVFHAAATYDQMPILKNLLSDEKWVKSVPYAEGEFTNAIRMATKSGSRDVVELLMEHPIGSNFQKYDDGLIHQCLSRAATDGSTGLVEYFLKHPATKEYDISSAAHVAEDNKQYEVLALLVKDSRLAKDGYIEDYKRLLREQFPDRKFD